MEWSKVEEKAKYYLNKIRKEDKKIKSFLNINENIIKEARNLDKKKGKKGRLFGKIFGIKSNINVKGMICSCASKTLEDYKSGFDATVIKKIRKEDGLIIGMTNMDEFACGSSGESGAFGMCENPVAFGRIPGGSSSGSVAAVAAEFCDVSLGSDTGGSIRNPASHCSVVGVKPSYGLVSRYGLIDLAMSLDQIGPISKNVEEAALVLNVIKGKDDKDTTTFESEDIILKNPGKIKIGLVRFKEINERIKKFVNEKVKKISAKLEWNFEEIEIPYIELAVQTYYPLVYVEFFSATRRFDGRKYGKKIEENCGEEVLRRILGGSEITKAEFRGAYYKKALNVRELIREELENVLKRFDCLISPSVPFLPWKIGKGKKMKAEEIYASDALTIPASLAGICAISLPIGKIESIPVGMQIMCGRNEDAKMLSISREIEKLNDN